MRDDFVELMKLKAALEEARAAEHFAYNSYQTALARARTLAVLVDNKIKQYEHDDSTCTDS